MGVWPLGNITVCGSHYLWLLGHGPLTPPLKYALDCECDPDSGLCLDGCLAGADGVA